MSDKPVQSAVERVVDAPALFDAWRAWNKVDWEMYERVCAIFGDVEDMAHDGYDSSLEIYIERDLVPTAEQVGAILAMGFAKFWINFPDETEICCGQNFIGERKKRTYAKWRSGGRKALPSSTAAPTFEQIRDAIAIRMGGHTISADDLEAWRTFLALLRMVKESECAIPQRSAITASSK